jgi:hypothetical protein
MRLCERNIPVYAKGKARPGSHVRGGWVGWLGTHHLFQCCALKGRHTFTFTAIVKSFRPDFLWNAFSGMIPRAEKKTECFVTLQTGAPDQQPLLSDGPEGGRLRALQA